MFTANGNGALVGREKGLVGPAAGGVQVGEVECVAVEPLKESREKGAPGTKLNGRITNVVNGKATVTVQGLFLSGYRCDWVSWRGGS